MMGQEVDSDEDLNDKKKKITYRASKNNQGGLVWREVIHCLIYGIQKVHDQDFTFTEIRL